MRLAQASLLLLLVAGCATATPDVPLAPGAEVALSQPTTPPQAAARWSAPLRGQSVNAAGQAVVEEQK